MTTAGHAAVNSMIPGISRAQVGVHYVGQAAKLSKIKELNQKYFGGQQVISYEEGCCCCRSEAIVFTVSNGFYL